MSMTKVSMADYIETRIAAITEVQYSGSDPTNIDNKRREYLEAFCQGIIDEITNKAQILDSGGHTFDGDGSHTHAIGKID